MKKTFTYLLTLFIFSACSSGEPGLPEIAEDETEIFFRLPLQASCPQIREQP
ncbi:MAG: hypothetical protein LUE98_20585 [Tannerellaceae bacterium]|nr:hypothetical protein [Tannerellaceae bacterium]MCD8179662.1 hypothetical protein [Tannerellaceae bacterium]